MRHWHYSTPRVLGKVSSATTMVSQMKKKKKKLLSIIHFQHYLGTTKLFKINTNFLALVIQRKKFAKELTKILKTIKEKSDSITVLKLKHKI